jgi:monoamine oxidase
VVYDALGRVGGRAFSLRGAFATKCELGGELIDTGHRHIQRLTRDLGLTLLDQVSPVASLAGDRYALGGRVVPLAEIVEQFRAVTPVLEADYAALGPSEYVTFDESTAAGRRLERTSIAEWFDRAGVRGRPGGASLAPVAAHPPTHPPTHPLTHPLTHSPTHPPTCRGNDQSGT